MSIINGILYFLGRITDFISSPFRALGVRPLAPFRSIFYTVRSLRLPDPRRMLPGLLTPFRTLVFRVQSLSGQRSPRLKQFWQNIEITRQEREYEAIQDEPFFARRERAEFSQIHLVDTISGQRRILHIGTTIGRSTSDYWLENSAHTRVRLRFTQASVQQYGAPMRLQLVNGTGRITLDDRPLSRMGMLPVNHGAVLAVNGYTYHVELYAWKGLPAVTRVNAAWQTSTGPIRSLNQDAIGIFQHPAAYLFAVADGVGGAAYGEKVSEFVIQYLLAVFHENVNYGFSWYDVFEVAARTLNEHVRQFVHRIDDAAATTLTAVIIQDWEAIVLHIGDSCLYHRPAGGTMTRITSEHRDVVPQEGMDGDTIERHLLNRAIGKRDTIDPEILSVPLQPGDRLLLVTDGINELTEDDLAQHLLRDDLDALPQTLFDMADERGNDDNVSAIVIEVLSESRSRDTWLADPDERVYVNYDRRWPLRLRAPRPSHQTRHPVPRIRLGCGMLAALIIGAGLLFGLSQRNIAATPMPPTATQVLSTPSTTPTPVPSVTPTPPVTWTPLPRQPDPTATPVPPPTRTLAPSARQPAGHLLRSGTHRQEILFNRLALMEKRT